VAAAVAVVDLAAAATAAAEETTVVHAGKTSFYFKKGAFCAFFIFVYPFFDYGALAIRHLYHSHALNCRINLNFGQNASYTNLTN
jgi:hypothetical protein